MAQDSQRDVFAHSALKTYTATAQRAAREVIRGYSTSFYAATRLLGLRNRGHVRSIYALVRVADELVDGVTSATGLDRGEHLAALDAYESATLAALRTGFSTDLIIHAFAHTARVCGIDGDLVTPFFASMRTDLLSTDGQAQIYDEAAHREYVYGSAEVVGLMCLRVFTRGLELASEERQILEHGARQLGAALQNINFLRDIGDDTRVLGRHYLGTLTGLDEEEKTRWVAVSREQLGAAREAIDLLPKDSARAVLAAHGLFSDLLERIDQTDCAALHLSRVRVPDAVKAKILASSVFKPHSRV